VATNRPTINRRDYKGSEGLIIGAVWNRSLSKQSVEGVRHSSSSQEFTTGVVYASSRQRKNQKKLLVYVIQFEMLLSDCKLHLMFIQ
jgi:hypothetical protein